MNYIGIDIGSTAAKVSVFSYDGLITNFTMPTGWNSVDTSNKILEKIEELNINIKDSKIIATGYGRISVPYANKTITEITCHGRGAYYLINEDCTIIDIGGQDTKIITLQEGKVSDFIMNDKCAAGTGRFLELMSNILGVTIEELGNMALVGEDIKITSMCTVFAESEVVSLLANGSSKESVASGILHSIGNRIVSLTQRLGAEEEIAFTGGLAKSNELKKIISEGLEKPIFTSPYSQYNGAIGAAVIGYTLSKRKVK